MPSLIGIQVFSMRTPCVGGEGGIAASAMANGALMIRMPSDRLNILGVPAQNLSKHRIAFTEDRFADTFIFYARAETRGWISGCVRTRARNSRARRGG